jgi:hypothetical protein
VQSPRDTTQLLDNAPALWIVPRNADVWHKISHGQFLAANLESLNLETGLIGHGAKTLRRCVERFILTKSQY